MLLQSSSGADAGALALDSLALLAALIDSGALRAAGARSGLLELARLGAPAPWREAGAAPGGGTGIPDAGSGRNASMRINVMRNPVRGSGASPRSRRPRIA